MPGAAPVLTGRCLERAGQAKHPGQYENAHFGLSEQLSFVTRPITVQRLPFVLCRQECLSSRFRQDALACRITSCVEAACFDAFSRRHTRSSLRMRVEAPIFTIHVT